MTETRRPGLIAWTGARPFRVTEGMLVREPRPAFGRVLVSFLWARVRKLWRRR